MGGASKSKPLQVATLNFAGITHSPFEFYSGTRQQQAQLEELSRIFRDLYQMEKEEISSRAKSKQNDDKTERINQDISEWKLANIDKCMQRERYSPLYRRDAGILGGRLMTRSQFEKKWDQQYDKNCHYVKFNETPTKTEIYQCRTFDYLIFKTFVEYLYVSGKLSNGVRQRFTLQKRCRQTTQEQKKQPDYKQRRKLAVVEYQAFLDVHFAKPYLKLQTKIKSLNKIIQKTDILFLQDASDELINSLKNEGKVSVVTRQGIDCAILVKKGNKFQKLYDQKMIFERIGSRHNSLDLSHFNYNPLAPLKVTTTVCFVDYFILMNIHVGQLNKKKVDQAKKITQTQKILRVMRHLLSLKNEYPDLDIIAAGDFNTFFVRSSKQQDPQDENVIKEFYKRFYVYPQNFDEKTYTTKKKRTSLHTQNKKYEKQDKSCVDFIISSLKLQNAKIQQLGQIIKLSDFNLPAEDHLLTQDHPFDHLIVSAKVIRDL